MHGDDDDDDMDDDEEETPEEKVVTHLPETPLRAQTLTPSL